MRRTRSRPRPGQCSRRSGAVFAAVPRRHRSRSSPIASPPRSGPERRAPRRVINATGVIIHTNLGRAPWPRAAIEAAERAAAHAALPRARPRDRAAAGRRYRAAEELLIGLTGADDALVTNNNAAALALAVGLAGRAGVAVSRGELVEIGGGVRIPEIIRRAGAKLVEVGTTNRTRAEDFGPPLAEGRARMVLRVHPSNFQISGFTEAPDPVAVAALTHEHGAFLVDDLGSGALLDTAAFGLAHEPMPRERLVAGADLVTFSGDKLLGGPQAGLIVGRSELIARLRRDPLARAMRPDKVTLAALAATLDLYRAGLATTADSRVADDRGDGTERAGPGRAPGCGAGDGRGGGRRSSSRRSAAARCPAKRCRRSALPSVGHGVSGC